MAAAAVTPPPFVSGEIVVAEPPRNLRDVQVKKYLPLSGLSVLSVAPGRELAAVARQRGLGRRAMLNLEAQAFADTADPYSAYQWHFDTVQASSAWTQSTGSGITVAVLDTGLAGGGNDGIGCVVPGIDIVNSDNDPADGDGHGTHVAGTVAQATNNGTGVAGLAYGACIQPVKVLSDSGSGSFADIAEGIYWAVNNGARVINMSLGVNARYRLSNDPVMDPALDYAYANGVTVVAAAGNDGNRRNVSYPAIYPSVIAVGATDALNQLASYSNRGDGLDLMAPGGDTARDNNGDGYPDGVLQETRLNGSWNYYFFQGTSMASPHVAAAAAILLANENLSPDQVRQRLAGSALDLGSPGYDSTFGHGLIRIADALGGGSVSNSTPVARFDVGCNELSCGFDASTSTDPDGDTLSYSWDFGDGVTASGVQPAHTYGGSGDYRVLLTVSDPAGAFDQAEQFVSVSSSTPVSCIDGDGDGFCASNDPVADDCNDFDDRIYPGHPDKGGRWGRDGLDNDCNGVIDG
jgi:serine protease